MIYGPRSRILSHGIVGVLALMRPGPRHPVQQTPRSPAQTIKRLPR